MRSIRWPARFGVFGEIVAPRSYESLAAPGAFSSPVGFAPDYREDQGGMLLPPSIDERAFAPPLVRVLPLEPGGSTGGR